MYEGGLSMQAVGARLGTGTMTVQRRLREAGVQPRTPKDWAKGTPPIPVDEGRLRFLASEGWSTREIGEALGVSEETARRRMVALGIDRLPAKARPDRNVFWRGGRTVDKAGYILIHAPDHPHATKGGYVREHRLVMERELGRYLLPDEVVDHRDTDTGNNDPSNLRLFASNADHLRETLKGQVPQWTPEGRARTLEGIRAGNRRRAASRRESGSGAPATP